MKRNILHPSVVRLTRSRAPVLTATLLAALTVASTGLVGGASASPTAEAHDHARSVEVATGEPANAVVAWNANAGEASVAACFIGGYGPQEARMYAMMHIAIHDALNGIDRRSDPYAADLHSSGPTSARSAVAAAAHDVLIPTLGSFSFFLPADCISAGIASVEVDYTAALDQIPNSAAKARGIALGQQAAAAILDLRADDGYDTPPIDPAFQEGTEPGEYRYTPGTPFAFAPHLGTDLRPFALKSGSQFRPRSPYKLTSPTYAADVNEIQHLGGDGVSTPSNRTEEQTEIALFWVESSPLLWSRIARTVATSEGLDMWQSARLFALLNAAMTDGYVGTFETKYHYLFWRPVTAIRLADTDGNPATTADPTWTPLLPTPPIPDYDSGHAVEGGTAAEVLKQFFHDDSMDFSICSFTLPTGQTCTSASPTMRSFSSFSEAAQENAVSRIYVGFHFRDAVVTGTHHGRQIGRWTVNHILRPGGAG